MRNEHKEKDDMAIKLLFVLFVFTIGVVVGNCGRSIVHAQEREVTGSVALARLCINEAGTNRDECAAIHATIVFRARYVYRSSYLIALHRYSRNATIDRTNRNRPWIAHLWPNANRPLHWPRNLNWPDVHRPRWIAMLDLATALIDGREQASCEPHGWARHDVRPADRTMHPIDCGDTRNVFWSLPAYVRRVQRERS